MIGSRVRMENVSCVKITFFNQEIENEILYYFIYITLQSTWYSSTRYNH